ncbi:MAG TPA: hypothetical protein VIY48_19175 [Candidatus Paceibacterota bacterium]
MKTYVLNIWIVGQHLNDAPWYKGIIESANAQEALEDVTKAMRNPSLVLTLWPSSGGPVSAVSGSKILWATAM